MYVYYVTILATVVTSFLAQIKKRNSILSQKQKFNSFFVMIVSLILICVSGLRWKIGTDYWQYMYSYKKYIITSWYELNIIEEPGIKVISTIASRIYDDYATMFFIAALITVGLFVKTISKHSNMLTFSLLIYIFTGAYHGSFNGVRQYIACSIIFAGHYFIVEKKFLKYLFIVLLASLFHISALGMIVLYFVPQEKLNFKKILLLIFIAIIAMYSYDLVFRIIETIKDKEMELNPYMTRNVNTLRVAVAFAPLFIYYILSSKQTIKSEDYFYINMLFINAAIAFATSNSAYLTRFMIYTNVYLILALPRLINFKDRQMRVAIKAIIIILYAIFWYISIKGNSALNNFKWIFNRY